MSQTAQKTLSEVALPAPGTWQLDPAHSGVTFSVRHLMVAKVRGRFGDVSGEVRVAADPYESSAEIAMAASSIDTGNELRDGHLRSPDFLDVDRYPALRFESTGVEPTGGATFRLRGLLTIKDVTRPVELEAEYGGTIEDPQGRSRAFFAATTEIDREDWGITWNQALETGGVVVGKRISIAIDVELTRI